MKKILIAGCGSGCGKTTITCALLGALIERKFKIAGFKCGPDYIDPMFHAAVLGVDTGNLDSYLMDESAIRYLFYKNSGTADIAVIEGVMGYYDGQGLGETGSTYSIAKCLNVPVVLVVNAKGMGSSVLAVIKGFSKYKPDSFIRAVIFNQLSNRLYTDVKRECENMGIKVLGNFPAIKEAEISSRHLGLITAAEISDIKHKMNLLAKAAAECIDIDGFIEVAAGFETKSLDWVPSEELLKYEKLIKEKPGAGIKIAVARDEAFCFYYRDNIELLKELGCEIVEFSPLGDDELPEAHGLILGGGYPELYAKKLSENRTMKECIRQRIESGLTVHAECGGFMYLHEMLENPQGESFEMVGAFKGKCSFTPRLQHFGYVSMTALEPSPLCKSDEIIRAHEFHRSVSDIPANVFLTVKGDDSWNSYVRYKNVIGGFPHIHYYSNLNAALEFIKSCKESTGRAVLY